MKITPLLFAIWLIPLASLQANDVGARQTNAAFMAPMPPPEPPASNPHPPQSAEDKRRVDFAIREAQDYYGPGVELRHAHLIPWAFESFQRNRQAPVVMRSEPNVIVEAQDPSSMKRPPVSGALVLPTGPQLQPDEYMVHIYARFKGDPDWYHLDVIMTEDASGNPVRRRFFRLPMPQEHGRMPPGVVC